MACSVPSLPRTAGLVLAAVLLTSAVVGEGPVLAAEAAEGAVLAAEPTETRAVGTRGKLEIAILDLEPVGASTETARNLTALIAAEVDRYHDVSPITRREVASLLDHEAEKQLMGCTDDGCLSEIVGALNVDKLLGGQLGQVERSYVLTLVLIDVATAKVDRRVSRVVPIDSGGLVDSVKSAVISLIGPLASASNQPPRLAVAAHLVAETDETVRLDASRCYDPDGDPLQITWRQVSGPPALLETPDRPESAFVAHDQGTYTFAVRVTDGLADVQEENVEVRVRPRRRFFVALGYKYLLSFNRIVEPHAPDVFRNRAPYGGTALFGFKLTDRWSLVGEGTISFMHVFPESADTFEGATKTVDVFEPSVLLGARYRFPFDGFDFIAAASVGTSRLFISASNTAGATELHDTRVRAQCVVGDLAVGVDVPAGERFGLLLQGGLRARLATEEIGALGNTGLVISDNGFLWGTNLVAAVYLRL